MICFNVKQSRKTWLITPHPTFVEIFQYGQYGRHDNIVSMQKTLNFTQNVLS
jgi:hypothetical protein